MEAAILLLIQDDIKLVRLNMVLLSIGWNAETLSTNNLCAIALLLEIDLTDELTDEYYRMISSENLPEEILNFLRS